MPHLTLQIGPGGPLLDVLVSASAPRQTALTQAGQPVPPAQTARALIDTGASVTAIDPTILTALALTPTGQTTIHTPSTGNHGHSCSTYDIHLTLSHPSLSFYISALRSDPIQPSTPGHPSVNWT
jgi:hypothetical protein